MTKPLRLALIVLPAVSLGILSWVPFLWLAITRPKAERPTYVFTYFATATGVAVAYVWMAVAHADGNSIVFAVALLLLAGVTALSCALAYLMTRVTEKPPAA